MKHLLAALLFALMPVAAMAQPADWDDLSNEDIIADAGDMHPAALYLLSSRLLSAGDVQEAANWMYAGQIRYRFLLAAGEDTESQEDGVLFSALTEQVARPVNEAIGADVDNWIAAMEWALEWDDATPNGTTSKTDFADDLAEIRSGLAELIVQVDGSREEIREQRAANGLENS